MNGEMSMMERGCKEKNGSNDDEEEGKVVGSTRGVREWKLVQCRVPNGIAMEDKLWTRKGLCEKFRMHIYGWVLLERDNAVLDLLANEVELD